MSFNVARENPRHQKDSLLRFIRDHSAIESLPSSDALRREIERLGGKIVSPKEQPQSTSTGWAGKTGGFFRVGKSIVEANIGQDQFVNVKVWVNDIDSNTKDSRAFLLMFDHLKQLLVDEPGAGYDVGSECMNWIDSHRNTKE